MLKREPNSKIKIDKVIWSEVRQLDRMLMNLAKQQGASTAVQRLAGKAIEFSGENKIETSVVFLTGRTPMPALQKAIKWLGIDTEPDLQTVFSGKVKGTLIVEGRLHFKMQMFHFDHYPARVLPECNKALTIVIYDPSFKANYPNWDLALQVLGMDSSVCILVNLSEEDIETPTENTPRINTVLTRHLNLGHLGESLREVLANEEITNALQLARLLNHLNFSVLVHKLISESLKDKEERWHGKDMLIHKKQLQIQQNNADRSGKEIAQLKLKIDGGYKQLIGFVEGKTENLDRISPEYRALEEEITSFLGLVENKGSRHITLKISEGAIRDKLQKANGLLIGFFDEVLEVVNKGIKNVEEDINTQFNKWHLDPPKIETPLLHGKFNGEVLAGSTSLPDKPYEKQIISKGIGSLLLELRTPLFMLMPFMMIFALFASLVGEADKGSIDETVMFHENRPVVAIDQLPESRANEFGRFIGELERYNAPGKGVFEKGITGELSTEPQLAVQTVEMPQNYGNRTKLEHQLDYNFDSKNQIVYLYLNPNADRNFVIDKLYDPSLELLTIPASTRRGFGIGGLIRFLSGLHEYRYIIFIGLLALISWFVITRKRSMDAELAAAKNKERSKLNGDLKQYVNKMVKLNVQKWRSKLTNELGDRENVLLKKAEQALGQNIEIKQQQRTQEKKIIQKRMASLKVEKSKLSNLKSEHRKLRTKYDQLQKKIKRMIR